MSRGLTFNKSPYRMPSFKEAMASWWIAREPLGGYFVGPSPALIVAIAIIPLLFFYIPIIPKSYEFQFKDKMRQDIPEAELKFF
jgi:hypothetical protein